MIITTVVKNSIYCGVFLKRKLTMNNIYNEHWKDIEGYDGLYQVSDIGRVRSRKSGEWKVLKPKTNGRGYLQVGLYKGNKAKVFLVHRLVADAFIPNTDSSKTQINHINEIKSDNRFWNLEYCTPKYNTNYNNVQFRKKNSVRRKIEKLYDPNISIKQNIELFRTKGVECSRYTVWRLCKDLGLTKKTVNAL